MNAPTEPSPTPARCGRLFYLQAGAIVLLLYLLGAYVTAPRIWERDLRKHPKLFDAPRLTHTPTGIPGDPVNLAMLAAKWDTADPITLASSLRIAVDSVFRRPDTNAPVSTLELFGRKQDLAFGQPVVDNPRQRHHVRFWHWDRPYEGCDEKPGNRTTIRKSNGKGGGGSSCSPCECIENSAQGIMDESPSYHPTGPNSNTYASKLLDACGLKVPPVQIPYSGGIGHGGTLTLIGPNGAVGWGYTP